MMSFTYRSNEKELIDRTDIPFKDIKQNMQELEFINRRLGGHEITLDGIVSILSNDYNFNNLNLISLMSQCK